ncbi:FAD-dependent oxidoreductase [Streptomyces sp. NPDC006655]|uniref:FAD-dependent oxidoreductase n=1 Tax=Streptomyces sp. NPDC006655 TaxID=3156898 RepID=UPI003454B808
MNEQVDVVVVGLGPGGEYLAGTLAEAGLDVVGVEAELVGGECPYWGCVPSKMMVRAGNVLAEARRVAALAGQAEVAPDFVAVHAEVPVERLQHMIHTCPTFHRAVEAALAALR